MSFPDDKDILELIRSEATRNEGFRFLVARYKEKLYWHIRRMVHEHEDADDVLQNTFMKVIRHIEGFKEQSSLYTWIYRIASNEAINFLHSRQRQTKEATLGLVSAASVDQHDNHSPEAMLDLLARAIDTLPEKQKLVFNLRYYDEMPYHQIAEITETSEGALKASYHLAVRKIEDFLKARA
jgi:RNA polymerase sigma-70 factor (ECF subfamily)